MWKGRTRSLSLKIRHKKAGENDSGVDEEYVASKNEKVKFFTLRRKKSISTQDRSHGSIWNLFRVSRSYEFPQLNVEEIEATTYKIKNEDSLHQTSNAESCPVLFSKANEENQMGKLEVDTTTSDLGESVPSTPVSSSDGSALQEEEEENTREIPGLVGMHNLGNSCYLNSILQCISHIDILSQYFGLDLFVQDVTQTTFAHKFAVTKKHETNNNTQGELTHLLAYLIKSLWKGDFYDLSLVIKFHKLVGCYNSQYKGAEQQDAQEFLLWLIDKIHEESVLLPKMKPKDLKKKKHQSDDEQAVLAFASHTQYNSSYVQGLFLSQYRSTITCPQCGKQSSTFDPFTCVSLSIPQRTTQPLYVTVIFSEKSRSPVQIAFSIDRSLNVSVLKEKLKEKMNFEKVFLLELQRNGTHQILSDKTLVGSLPIFEFSVYAIDTEEAENTDDITLVVSNVEVWDNEQRRFGIPSVISVTSAASFKDMQVCIRKSMSKKVKDTLTKIIREKMMKLGLRVVDPQSKKKYFLRSDVENPLQAPEVASALIPDAETGSKLLYLVAEWESVQPGWHMGRVGITLPFYDSSCEEVRLQYSNQEAVDLEDCLKLETGDEKLEDAWKCPFCRNTQNGVIKKLTLWSLPDILVLHLKRFDQLNGNKISTLVNFPIEGLNMSPHVSTTKNQKLLNKMYKKESVRMNYLPPPQTEAECMYDLKAVCNHLGSQLNSGHYVSTCYNSVSESWYKYDDRSVEPVFKENLVTNGAYLLFYQRRKLTSRIPDQIYLSVTRPQSMEKKHWSDQIVNSNDTTQDGGLKPIVRQDDFMY